MLTQGQILNNRYRIAKLLGEGGFGAVYKAWDMTLNVPCAVKESFELSPEGQRQFLREAQILAGLRHPNLPRVTDYFALPGQGQYLVMDFVEGQDLDALIAQAGGKLPEAQVLNWIAQVCDALAYMHRQPDPVIHRDIKPANIKITPPDEDTPQGRAMLVDFGVAKLYDPKSRTTVGARAVTPGYSPHEQYGQTRAATDARTDIYALGATLYSLLTGHEPVESILRVVDDTLVPPRQLEPGISEQAEALILKAMQVNPTQRYQKVGELKGAINTQLAASGGRRVVTQPPSATAAPVSQTKEAEPSPSPVELSASGIGSGSNLSPATPAAEVQEVQGGQPAPDLAHAPAGAPAVKPSQSSQPTPDLAHAPAAAPGGKATLYIPEEEPTTSGKPGLEPVSPQVEAPAGLVKPPAARRIPWAWISGGIGAVLIVVVGLVWALRPKEAPVTVKLPEQFWVAVMSQGTSITRQAFWYTNDFGDLKTFIEDKLDQEYQITELEYSSGTWTVVLSQGTGITRQAFWYTGEYSEMETFIREKLDQDYQITSLDFSDGLWVAVMSQGTGITRQAFWFRQDYGEMENFIREKLGQDYQITSLEYSNNTWTVVMSQGGIGITRQAFWYSGSYPVMEAFIREKLDQDYQISTLEYSDGLWVVVMSQGTWYTRQAFWFTSSYGDMQAFIQTKLDEDYQISSFSR